MLFNFAKTFFYKLVRIGDSRQKLLSSSHFSYASDLLWFNMQMRSICLPIIKYLRHFDCELNKGVTVEACKNSTLRPKVILRIILLPVPSKGMFLLFLFVLFLYLPVPLYLFIDAM